jgi:hypothetical protein
LEVRGSGATDATYGFYIENSTPTGVFACRDDQRCAVGSGSALPSTFDVDPPNVTGGGTTEQIQSSSSSQTIALANATTRTNQRQNQFLAPLLNGVSGGGTETFTNAATVYIDAAPSGTDSTITNAYALWVDAGTTKLDGALTVDGVVDLGGATSAEVPNGTGPTVDAAGEIAVDTTDDQLIYYGGSKRVVAYEDIRCHTIENLNSTDDNMALGMFADAVTVTSVGCSYVGTGTTVATIALEDGGGTAMTHTGPTCVAHGTNATFQAVTAAGAIVAGEIARFDTTNTPAPVSDDYTICYTYTVDAQ